MCEVAVINGHLVTNDYDDFTAVQTFSGGYFALPTNKGYHKRTRFAVIPESKSQIGVSLK